MSVDDDLKAGVPTPATDPNGLAATVMLFVNLLLVAVDPGGALSSRWGPLIPVAVALAGLLWARRKAWSPLAVWLSVLKARQDGVIAGAVAVASTEPDVRIQSVDPPQTGPPKGRKVTDNPQA